MCFKGVDINKRSIVYATSSNAWMTDVIFDKWLDQFSLRIHGHKVLFLLDNPSSHRVRRELTNVTVVFSRLT